MQQTTNLMRYLIIGLLWLLTGCSMAPTYQQPTPDIPETWPRGQGQLTHEPTDWSDVAWWQQYHDPTLNDLIQQSLNHNNELKASLMKINASKAQLERIQLGWLPSFQLSAGVAKQSFLGIIPQYLLNVSQQVDKQRYQYLDVQQKQAIANAVRVSLIGQVAQAYFTLLAEKDMASTYEQLIETIDHQMDLMQKQQQLGLIAPEKQQPLKVKHNQLQAKQQIIQHNIIKASNALYALLGQPPGHIIGRQNLTKLKTTTVDANTMPATILENRPDVQIAELSIQKANQAIGIARSHWFPTISLQAFIGRQAGNDQIVPLSDRTIALEQAMIQMDFDPSTIGLVKSAQSNYQVAYFQYFQTVYEALKQVDTAFSANQRYTNAYQQTQQAYDTVGHTTSLKQNAYELGLSSKLSVLQQQTTQAEHKIQVIQAKLKQLLTTVALYQALGGGYNTTDDSLEQ